MSGTVSRSHAAGQQAEAAAATVTGAATRRSRRVAVWLMSTLVLVLVAGGAAAAWRAGAFVPAGSPGPGAAAAPAPATAQVMRPDLSQTTTVNATLGYAGSYTVRGQGSGTLTWLPFAGQVIGQGHVLYRVDNGIPVVLLCGSVPDWRAMSEGDSGADVTQLNHDLVNLGYADSADIAALGWNYYSWEAQTAVQQMQSALGISSPSGALPLGSAVFEPAA
ncbi:MAG TPA: hypothetical protein VGI05_00550, partial [Streptosporangiaceae bacterium]